MNRNQPVYSADYTLLYVHISYNLGVRFLLKEFRHNDNL